MTPTAPDAAAHIPASPDQDWQTARQIVHDLNNLMSAIQGYAEMLLESAPADAETSADLRRIHEAALQAATRISELRALARRGAAAEPIPARD